MYKIVTYRLFSKSVSMLDNIFVILCERLHEKNEQKPLHVSENPYFCT